MFIYTSTANSVNKLNMIDKYELGFMIPSLPDRLPGKECIGRRCALDNGAFISHKRGFPFFESVFMKTMEKCYKLNLNLDFIVIPDIVAGGLRSLNFSAKWVDRLIGGRLALAVQDGITPRQVELYFPLKDITTIFIGGTVEWKWNTLSAWKESCDKWSKKIHVGRCGTLDNLTIASAHNVDSVDSSSFVRNDSWNILKEFKSGEIGACPSCGATPIIDDAGMVECPNGTGNTKCMMIGCFSRKSWDRHSKSGNML